MEIRKLEWDSEFFGLQIGRVDLQTKEEVAELLARREELQQQFDLLYIFDPNDVGFVSDEASLVDEKILYNKACEPRTRYPEVSYYRDAVPSVDLYHLALVSGEFSRFRLDKRLPEGSYEHLYRKWIENACPRDGSNKRILAYIEDNIPRGMITVDYKDDHAQIGLVAVDSQCQHKGIGTKIMSALERGLYEEGVMTIDVATQKANKDACRWYEKNGFKVKSVTPIYHWWL